MNAYYWDNESWGSADYPENIDEIISTANEMIDRYIEENNLDPESSDDEWTIRDYSDSLWERYCATGNL